MLIVVLNSLKISYPADTLAQGFELRLDCFAKLDFDALKQFMASISKPVIFTLRPERQGGRYLGREAKRLTLIEKLCSLHPAFFDLEADTDPAFLSRISQNYPTIKLIGSFHNFLNTPDNLNHLFEEMQKPYFFAYKLATMANSSIDALRMASFVRQKRAEGHRLTGLTMGQEGEVSRILGPIVGNFMCYAAPDAAHIQAPGQLTVADLSTIYRYRKLNAATAVYALIGDPVKQSLGHLVHNAAFEAQGVDAVYVKIRLKAEEVPEFKSLLKSLNIKGLSVTMPLKEAIVPFVLVKDKETLAIGALNTVFSEDGEFYGANTDGVGALEALKQFTNVKDKRIVLIGAGGAARGIAYALKKAQANLIILNRTANKAAILAAELKAEGGGLNLMEQECLRGYDILINTTPIEMPITPSWIRSDAILMDINVQQKEDSLLSYGRQIGAHCIGGYEMFIFQAIEQQKIWLKRKFLETIQPLVRTIVQTAVAKGVKNG